MKATDLAYAAGVIDGEGCIVVRSDKPGQLPRVSVVVSMNDFRVPTRLREIFGCGSLALIDHARSKRVRCRTSLRWQIRARDCERVLPAVLPFLISKREQAEKALEIRKLAGYRGRAKVTVEILETASQLEREVRALKLVGDYRDPPTGAALDAAPVEARMGQSTEG